MTKLDDWSWHEGAENFPEDLEPENGATHLGMFAAWVILHGMWAADPFEDPKWVEALERVRKREMTGSAFLLEFTDGKLDTDDMSADGGAFAENYYERQYLEDYDTAVGDGLSSLYEVTDSWETFDRLAPVLDRRWAEWSKTRGR